jgi:hypothetical protein
MMTATKYGLVRTELECDPKTSKTPYWTIMRHVLYGEDDWLAMGEHSSTREAIKFHEELVDKINNDWLPDVLETHTISGTENIVDEHGMQPENG